MPSLRIMSTTRSHCDFAIFEKHSFSQVETKNVNLIWNMGLFAAKTRWGVHALQRF